MMRRIVPKNKTGGVVSNTVMGVGGLIIGVIVMLVVIQTLNDASLLGTSTEEANVTSRLTTNFTQGIDNISSKIPTILLIVAVVFLFGALVLLIRNAKSMGVGGGSSL
ncbi:hypothetical protein CMI37_21800 [Candidatus Pacearchaeota archaeon]|nr:hypothetical protein [Candidatus Pacearchaeota archaeon]